MIKNDRPMQLFDMLEEWTYRGEGNCNIVISVPKQKKILRIRKIEKPKSILGWLLVLISDFIHWYYGKGLKDESRDLDFYLNIMRPLVGHKYTSDAKQVMLSRKHIHIFKEELSYIRPEFRQNKTLQYGRAALFDDFAFLPSKFDGYQFSHHTYSIEIKPKQGWRPIKEQLLPQCFFCMNQFLKMEKRQINTLTRYCPEELFCGNPMRMKKALKHLFEIPQNNFKIFKDGLLQYDEKHKNKQILNDIFETSDAEEILIDELCNFLQSCLTTDFNKNRTEELDTYHFIKNENHTCAHLEVHNLPVGSVLDRILSIQMLDKEGSHSTYKKLSKHDDWDNWSFVNKILDIVKNSKGCVKCKLIEASQIYEDELMFIPYLISAIAKDCSLMVTFRKLVGDFSDSAGNNHVFRTNYGYYLVNIGIFDLYPKPLSTIQKHYKRNKDIFRAFKKDK